MNVSDKLVLHLFVDDDAEFVNVRLSRLLMPGDEKSGDTMLIASIRKDVLNAHPLNRKQFHALIRRGLDKVLQEVSKQPVEHRVAAEEGSA